jgi:hypothetical protein
MFSWARFHTPCVSSQNKRLFSKIIHSLWIGMRCCDTTWQQYVKDYLRNPNCMVLMLVWPVRISSYLNKPADVMKWLLHLLHFRAIPLMYLILPVHLASSRSFIVLKLVACSLAYVLPLEDVLGWLEFPLVFLRWCSLRCLEIGFTAVHLSHVP